MSAFIVSGGSLFEIGCPSTLNRSTEQQVSFTRTLGGKRKSFARRGGRRSWSIDVSVAKPAEVSTLDTLVRHGGSVGWYGPEAVIGNLLSPQAVDWDPAPEASTDTGLIQLPDGSIARSVLAKSKSIVVGSAPVAASSPVAVGVWARGGVELQLTWFRSDGSLVSTETRAFSAAGAWSFRDAVFEPPAGSAAVQLGLSEGTQFARPSISWGSVSKDQQGSGCPAAVIHSGTFSPLALWGDTNFTNVSYSVTEIG